MGVNTKYYLMVGLKEKYNYIKSYKSKNDSDYLFDLEYGDTEDFLNIVFEDYLPPKYKVYSDGMCCLYSCIGKVLDSSEYIDEIRCLSLNSEELQIYINEVYEELNNLIVCKKEDIKLHIFVHFS